jgi:ADP-ribose pyrophosphatase YjhB (NUDIX family)
MADIIKLARLRAAHKAKSKRLSASASGRKKHRKAETHEKTSPRPPRWSWLEEIMRSPQVAPPRADGTALLESGVLAYRCNKKGQPSILMVSKKRSKKWGIPKGHLKPHLSFSENAAKEALEEAGVIGRISPHAIAMFRAKRRALVPSVYQVIEVWIYLLEVTETLSDWPEKGKRQTRWVSCETAARELREPVLVHLCHRLAQS